MNMKKQLSGFLLPCLCGAANWCAVLALHLSRLFFRIEERTSIFWIPKILLLLFLMAFWCFLFQVVRKLHSKDAGYLRGAQIFAVYFPILMVLMLILWPGTFSWDDAITLNVISYYDSFFPQQHILTGIYQDVLLHLLPFPGGMILLQNCIISVCVCFCVVRLEKAFDLKKLKNPIADILLKLLPFFAPPVIMYQFSGYRIGLYIFLELTVLVMLLCANQKDSPWSWSYLLLFAFLSVIVSVWRTEALVYIPFLAVLLMMVRKETLPVFRKVVCFLLILCGFFTMTWLQNRSAGDSTYQLISLVRPCTALVRSADPVEDAQALADIDRVVSLEVIRDNPEENGESLYWNKELTREYTPEDYKAFQAAMGKLCLKYPMAFLRERWDLFIEGSGLTGNSNTNVGSARFFDADYTSGAKKVTVNKNWVAFRPLFPQLRKSFIYLINGCDSEGRDTFAARIIINAILPELILLFTWVRLLVQKKWYPWLISSAVMAKLGVVFLTQPSRWFMYVLSFYLLGYLCLVYQIWIRIGSGKGNAK